MKLTTLSLLFISSVLLFGCKKEVESTPEPAPEPTCTIPSDIGVSTVGGEIRLYWDDDNIPEAQYYQVEYGIAGFTKGTGEIITTSNKQTYDVAVAGGNVYEFYIRGYCNSTLGFSDWSSSFSYYAADDYNLCNVPTSLIYTINYNAWNEATGAVLDWDHHGNNYSQITMVADGASPNSGTIENWTNNLGNPSYNLTQNTDYDFYVRTVCLDGSNSAWAGPLNVNIGQ